MAIDGRDVGKKPAEKDSYESPTVRIVAGALLWVPIALVLAFAYWSGTWMGGWLWGVINLVSAVAIVFVLWLVRSKRKR
jgi:hypothetical protein